MITLGLVHSAFLSPAVLPAAATPQMAAAKLAQRIAKETACFMNLQFAKTNVNRVIYLHYSHLIGKAHYFSLDLGQKPV
ncbi:hypothetical protein GGI43DRAFT_418906 [Trichoderma evansii]